MQTSTETTRTYSFADDDPIALDLLNHSGDVAVVLDAPEGTAEVTLTSRRPVDFEAVSAACTRGRVRIEIPPLLDPEGGSGFSFSLGSFSIGSGHEPIHVEVHLPPGADVTVATKQGDVVLQGTSGETRVKSGSGDLSLDETRGLRASTGSGDIRIGRMSAGAVSTGSGDVTIDVAAGPDALEIRTGSGDVSLVDSAQDVTIATGSGDVTARHTAGSFTARTGTGDVKVSVPHGIPVWLDLSSGMGDVVQDLDSVGAPAEGQDHLRVSVRTGTGDVTVHH